MKKHEFRTIKPFRAIDNDQGSMLIQALLSLAMMGVVISASATLFQQQWQQMAALEDRAQYRMLIEDVRMTLQTNTSCMGALATASFDVGLPTSPLRLKLTMEPQDLQDNINSIYYRTHIQKLELINKVNTGITGLNGDIYMADVRIVGRSIRKNGLQYPARVATKMLLEVNMGNIVSCTADVDPSAICTVLGTSFDSDTGQCKPGQLLSYLGKCPQGLHVRGFDGDGNLICGNGIGKDTTLTADTTTPGNPNKKTASNTTDLY